MLAHQLKAAFDVTRGPRLPAVFPDWLSFLTLALERSYWSEAVCDWLRLKTPMLTVVFVN